MSLTKEDLQAIGTLIDGKITPINARFDKLEQGQAATNAKLDKLEQEQTATNAKLDKLEQEQTATNAKLDKLEQEQAATNAKLDKFEQEQAATNAKLDKLEQGQAEMKALIRGSQEVIVEVVDVLGQKTDRIEKAIQDMQGAAAQNAYELQVLKSRAQ